MTRPLFHFTAQTGWINDPHGITYRDGGYDAYYQYVPGRTEWALNCHWGHARGVDLLSLVEREPAILPGDGDDGIWTGSLVNLPEGPRIFYTSVQAENIAIGEVRVATPDDDQWDTWSKGPVVIEAPPGQDLVGFRDPFLRRDPDVWRAFLGAGSVAGDALAYSYTSQDLEHWEYEGVALSRPSALREPTWMGAMWECPQIFEIGDRFVMLSSAWDADVLNYAGYAVGTYAAGVFTAEAWGRLTYGPSFYAPSFFRGADGRPCMSLWMRGVDDIAAGWAGAHSIPYVLGLEGDVLVAIPHPDLQRYRSALAESGRVAGPAADIEWAGSGELVAEDDAGSRLFRVVAATDEVTLEVGGERWTLPRAAPRVRIVVDAGVVEISPDRGLLGAGLAPAGPGLRIVGEGTVVHALERTR